ncbi:MAG: acyltransferase [Candidatus Hodarchaeota archaeon]
MKFGNISKLLDFKFVRFFLRQLLNEARETHKIYLLLRKEPSLNIGKSVRIYSPERLVVGKNVVIQEGTILHCGGRDWCDYGGGIRIGDDSLISPYCIFEGGGGIEVGERLVCGPHVKISSNRACYDAELIGLKNEKRHLKEVTIGNDVVLFGGVTVDSGVNIGNGAVIGAGSVVLSDIPNREVWAGIPAKFVKKRGEDKIS